LEGRKKSDFFINHLKGVNRMKRKGVTSFALFALPVLTICFLALSTFAGPVQAETKVLKIGLISSVTGPLAPAFKTNVEGGKATADFMNHLGGVTVKGQKYTIEVVTEDDQSSPPGAVAAMNKLLQAGVKFVVPPMFMPCDLAIAPIAEGAKILRMKSYGAGRDELNPNTKFMFYEYSSVYNIPPVHEYLQKHYPKVKKIAVITPDDPGAKTFQELAKKEFEKQGIEIVFWEAFRPSTEDFYPILTKALEKKPDAIDIIVSIIPWSAGIINQSRELGFTGPIFAPNLFGDINVLKAVVNPQYAYDLFHGGPDVQSPKMPQLIKDFRPFVEKTTKTPFDMGHTITLEAVYSIVKAIEKAQSLDTEHVVKYLETAKTVDTVFGPVKMGGMEIFGINHAYQRPIIISRIMKDKIETEIVK
jgi:branched-chain amino acid transport system substrate-binding protein